MHHLTRLLTPLAAIAVVASCTTWRVDQRPIHEVITRNANEAVAVSMRDLRWVVLRNPRIQNDSIVGSRVTGNSYGKGRTALALRGVTAVQTRRFSLIRTLALGAAAYFLPTLWHFATVDED
jgi:hypothetical protein